LRQVATYTAYTPNSWQTFEHFEGGDEFARNGICKEMGWKLQGKENNNNVSARGRSAISH